MEEKSLKIKELFLSEIKDELSQYSCFSEGLMTEDDIAPLPLPVRNYIRGCGCIGKRKASNARIFWKNVLFRRNESTSWMDLDCYQFNSTPEPCRIVYMNSRLFGLFPFEGRDKYQRGKGSMLIKLMRFFKIADVKSREMDISGLVTTLAETILIPSQALQNYIKWEPIDDLSARAIITFGGNSASGIFEFNKDFEITRFVTEDRFQSQKDNSAKNIRWAGLVGNYCIRGDVKFPSFFKAVWYQGQEEFEYFKGEVENINYDITGFDL